MTALYTQQRSQPPHRIKITQGKVTLKLPEQITPKKMITKEQLDALEKKVAPIEDETLREMVYKLGIARLEK